MLFLGYDELNNSSHINIRVGENGQYFIVVIIKKFILIYSQIDNSKINRFIEAKSILIKRITLLSLFN